MGTSLSKYKGLPVTNPSYNWIVMLALAALVVWFIYRTKAIAQYNEERVVIERDERGRIAAMSVHRSAK